MRWGRLSGAHAGQIDKANEPYILHPLRVMFGVEGEATATIKDSGEHVPSLMNPRMSQESSNQKCYPRPQRELALRPVVIASMASRTSSTLAERRSTPYLKIDNGF